MSKIISGLKRVGTHYPKMQKEMAQGKRICQFCEEPIKKGQSCYSIRIVTYFPISRGIHIHAFHVKRRMAKKCSHRMECITDGAQCKSPICELAETKIYKPYWKTRR